MTQIHAQGREWLTWTLTDAPEGDVSVSFDNGTTWHATVREGDEVRVLVTGTEAEDNPTGTVVLPAGPSRRVWFRAVDSPEVVIRSDGRVTVTHVGGNL